MCFCRSVCLYTHTHTHTHRKHDTLQAEFLARFVRFVSEFIKARDKWELAAGLVDKDKNASPHKSARAPPPAPTAAPAAAPADVQQPGAARRLDCEGAGAAKRTVGLDYGDRLKPSRALRGVKLPHGTAPTEPCDEAFLAQYAAKYAASPLEAGGGGDGGEVMKEAVQELKAAVANEVLMCMFMYVLRMCMYMYVLRIC